MPTLPVPPVRRQADLPLACPDRKIPAANVAAKDSKPRFRFYYPLPLHLQPVFSYLGMRAGDLPVAERAAQEVLALPMFPELTEGEIRLVVASISDFYS